MTLAQWFVYITYLKTSGKESQLCIERYLYYKIDWVALDYIYFIVQNSDLFLRFTNIASSPASNT